MSVFFFLRLTPQIVTFPQSVLSHICCILFYIQVKVGDILDFVLSEDQETNTVILSRVILKKVFAESSNTDKYKVGLRRWKRLELSKEDAFKP